VLLTNLVNILFKKFLQSYNELFTNFLYTSCELATFFTFNPEGKFPNAEKW
jgi:hypothetical protein